MSTWVDCKDSGPGSSIVRLTLTARGDMPPVKLTWWDGGMLPERPADLEPGRNRGFTLLTPGYASLAPPGPSS
jgi:hypothetical protein